MIDPERSLIALDGGTMAGTFMSFDFRMTIPGGLLPCAGIAGVTVQPTHRRQGILSGMMSRYLSDTHERGEPLASLWPSESVIYGRYGFGMSSTVERWTVERHHSALAQHPPESGRLRFVDSAEARDLCPPVYQAACEQRIGMIFRDDTIWDAELEDRTEIRRGMSEYFHVVHEGPDGVDGFVKYRISHADHKLVVFELIASTDSAHASLWRFCLGVDLMRSVEARWRPPDDPIRWMLADPNRLQRSLQATHWLRLVDVRAALSQRRYATHDRVVVSVDDELCSWNRGVFELEGGPDGAMVTPSSRTPDVSLSAADLGAAFLGGTSFTSLRQAGRVQEHTAGTLSRLNAMFANDLLPWCAQDF
jgi:predicted acetyltransferase